MKCNYRDNALLFICTTRSRLKLVQEQVAELEAKLAKLTAEFNAANRDKQEVPLWILRP